MPGSRQGQVVALVQRQQRWLHRHGSTAQQWEQAGTKSTSKETIWQTYV